MMRMSMNQKGIAEARGKIANMQRKVTNLRPVLAVGAADIQALMMQSFESESDPSGKEWAPLAESTIESRARRGNAAKRRDKTGKLTKAAEKIRAKRKATGGIKKLVVTGRLKNSMFARAESKGIKFGSNVKYLAPHQTGGVHLPKRMIAPVEKRGPNWALIKRGRANAVFDTIDKSITFFVKEA